MNSQRAISHSLFYSFELENGMMVYDDDSETPIDFITDFTYIPLLIKITNDNREKKIPSLSSCVKKYVGKTIAMH